MNFHTDGFLRHSFFVDMLKISTLIVMSTAECLRHSSMQYYYVEDRQGTEVMVLEGHLTFGGCSLC